MNNKFLNALKLVSSKLNESSVKWMLCGTTNYVLQGIDVHPNDIDISISHKDLEKIRKIFSEYNQSEINDLSNGEGQEFKFDVDGVEVQICADYEHGFYYKQSNKIKILNIDDIKIPALKLEAEIECCEHLKRPEKVKMLKEFLK